MTWLSSYITSDQLKNMPSLNKKKKYTNRVLYLFCLSSNVSLETVSGGANQGSCQALKITSRKEERHQLVTGFSELRGFRISKEEVPKPRKPQGLSQEPDVLGKIEKQIQIDSDRFRFSTKIKRKSLIFFKRKKLFHYLLGSVIIIK
jgi:hypothetical protein